MKSWILLSLSLMSAAPIEASESTGDAPKKAPHIVCSKRTYSTLTEFALWESAPGRISSEGWIFGIVRDEDDETNSNPFGAQDFVRQGSIRKTATYSSPIPDTSYDDSGANNFDRIEVVRLGLGFYRVKVSGPGVREGTRGKTDSMTFPLCRARNLVE